MKRAIFYILCFICFSCGAALYAQDSVQYRLDIYNDLPSNTVYHITADHSGYLWVATDRGVVRYNGYKFTFFDLNKGFVNKDTWNLFEDKKGNMWLFNLSDNFTYIHNSEVHSVRPTTAPGTFYPRYICDYKDGVGIIATFTNNPAVKFYYVRNDSVVFAKEISNYGRYMYVNSEGKIIAYNRNGYIYSIDVVGDETVAERLGNVRNYEWKEDLIDAMDAGNTLNTGKCLVSYMYNKNYIHVIDAEDYAYKRIDLTERENLKLLYNAPGQITAITTSRILSFDAHMNVIDSAPLPKNINENIASSLSFILTNDFWKQIIATNNNGLYFLHPRDTLFKTLKSLSGDLRYIGKIDDKVSFWYSNSNGTLCKVVDGAIVQQKEINVPNAAKLLPFGQQRSLLFNPANTYLVDNASLEVTDLGSSGGARNALNYLDSQVIYISLIKGLSVGSVQDGGFKSSIIDPTRYTGIFYDSFRNEYLVYNDRKISIFRKGTITTAIERKDLENRGINSIVKVVSDSYFGNYILQEGERIITFKELTGQYKPLFTNYVLNDAKLILYRNTVVVGGSFGVIFSRILGQGKFSEPVLCPNSRELVYKVVYDMQVVNNKVYLKTDKGFFLINIPADTIFSAPPHNDFLDYNLVVTYGDRSVTIDRSDTFNINKKIRKLLLDVVKPTGNGQLTYLYKISNEPGGWTELSSDELVIPKLAPGRYYTITIIAKDKQWRSDPRTIVIYIVPDWWEVDAMQKVLWVAAFLLMVFVVYAIVIVTKRFVDRANVQRNLRLELELKSVYSQINPHFIFNSLTAAMYLIKTGKLDEAYNHVHKFSHLLRAYIKSSRNRLITINEEVKNLSSYIELQQARFKNKFDFTIDVAPTVNTNTNIPSLLLQPIVENAITHGLLHKDERGTLVITFRRDIHTDELICTIDDDGVGREAAKEINETPIKEESYGSELIKDLINIFNKYETMKIEIEYFDKQLPQTGTTVTLRIKQLKNE